MAFVRSLLSHSIVLGALLIAGGLGGCSGGGGSVPSASSVAVTNKYPHPTPAPNATSGATSTASPTATATATAGTFGYLTSSASDAGFTQIVNPGQWPGTFRPYCANAIANPASPCPWNDSLPDNPQQIYTNSATIVASMFAGSDTVALPGDWSLGGDYEHAVYVASVSDPLVTVSCTAYCGITSATIHIPSNARAAGALAYSSSLDCHMAIIEPDGSEYDLYEACGYTGQSAFSVTGLWQTSILGSGQLPGGGATSGGALAAGAIRSDELARGVIPHALFASTNCISGSYVYPGGSQGSVCSSYTGPPIGARLQLTLTDSQITALGLPVWESAILRAMHDYGVYILDTNGAGIGLGLQFESQTQYAAYGATYPYSTMSLNIAAFDSALDWAHNFRIVAACYSQETCTQ
ncbi:MAG: hypothetical protein ACRENA_10015 [Vulcanimicrobiaceae bacterium]